MNKNNKKWTSLINYEPVIPFVYLINESKEIDKLFIDEFKINDKNYTVKKNNNTINIMCSDGRILFIGLGYFKDEKNNNDKYYLLTSYRVDGKEMIFRTNKINSMEENIYDILKETGEFYFTRDKNYEKIEFKDVDNLDEFEVLGTKVNLSNNNLSIDSNHDRLKVGTFSNAVNDALIIRSKILDGSISRCAFTSSELNVIYQLLKEELNKELESINQKKVEELKSIVKKLTPNEKKSLKQILD